MVYKAGPSNLALFFLGAAVISWLVFLVATGFPLYAWIYYRVKPDTSIKMGEILAGDFLRQQKVRERKVELSLPPHDVSLPDGYWLTIPKIEVDTTIWEAPYEEHERVLRKGVWRVPDFGTPVDGRRPIILTAHRFGYLEWSNKYRRQNSFFNLPKLQEGDKVETVWDKRRFEYRVIKIEELEKITNYNVDLILSEDITIL